MENITLHVLPEAFLFDLGKDVITGDGDWSEFLRQHRRKMAIMRGLGLKLDKPYPRPFNLPERGIDLKPKEAGFERDPALSEGLV
jgi:hypothetical protein